MERRGRGWTRRRLLLAGAAAGGAFMVGCGGKAPERSLAPAEQPAEDTQPKILPTAQPTPSPTPTPVILPAGVEERALLPGTPWETPLIVANSGVAGPVLLVLGGVHGNEPGGWTAADDITTWRPSAGRLLVLPRANREAISLFARTTDLLGDLNRLYPGKQDGALPMERMAHAIVSLARDEGVEYALDLHESWGFFATRAQNGTAFLGQTVTWGVGPANPDFGRRLVDRANESITVERDRLIERDGSRFRRSDGSSINGDAPGNRGRSSLSLGGHVPGLTPLLVEMGQQDQALARRVELHQLVVRAAMDELEM